MNLRNCLCVCGFLFALTACDISEPPQTYEESRKIFWQHLYADNGNSLYCRQKVSSQSRDGFNIEHVFPMAWAKNAFNCATREQCRQNEAGFNRIEADLHNLYPARTQVNYARSSYAYAQLAGESRKFGKSCDFEVDRKRRLAEPPPQSRGEIARAMLYMAWKYEDVGLHLFPKQAKLMQDWNQADLPTADERRRNDLIEVLQGNRNPFIDEPTLAAE